MHDTPRADRAGLHATMVGMTPEEEHELRLLRARAYGPGADITGDGVALRRLQELEERSRGRDADAGPIRDRAGAGDVSPFVDLLGDAVTPASGPSVVPSPAPLMRESTGPSHTPRPLTRRLLWAGAGTLALAITGAAVAASLLTAAIAPPAPMVPEARHEASLSLDDTFSWPGMFENGDGRFYAEYLGFRPVGTSAVGSGECLAVFVADGIDESSASFTGTSFYGCGGGGFPPTVVVPLRDDTPEAARRALRDARALQFVLRGSVVEVYSDGSGA